MKQSSKERLYVCPGGRGMWKEEEFWGEWACIYKVLKLVQRAFEKLDICRQLIKEHQDKNVSLDTKLINAEHGNKL